MEQAWNVKRDQVTNESNNIINAYNKKIQALQDDVKKAQQEYDTVRSRRDVARLPPTHHKRSTTGDGQSSSCVAEGEQ